MRNLKILFSYLGAYRRDAILGVLFVTAETALELFIPVIMANIIDVGVPAGDINYMLLQGTYMLACAACSLVLGLGYARTSARVASGLGANLREAEYRKIQTLAFGNLDNYDASSLVTRMTTDITVIQNAIGNGFRPMVRGPVTLIVGLAYALVLSRPLATVFAIILPVLAIVLGVITYRVSPLYRQLQTSMDHLNGVVQEDLTAVRAVKAYVRAEHEEAKFDAVNTELARTATKTFGNAVLNLPVFQLSMYVAALSILWIGGRADAVEDVLEHIDLRIESGSTVGILGGTGSGKSSLVQLIARLYDATEGAVLVGGHDVRDYDLATLRDAVGIVLQKNVLFTGTVRENLQWGNPQASDDELLAACRAACVDEFLDRIGGLDGELGQGGAGVSGGQKQRLCIARTLLKHPRVLIFDDSTSAVDMATDAKIRERIARIPNTTVLIIAQRIASVMDADRIVVLDDGRVHGVGTHEELLAGDNIYQEIYASQMEFAGNADTGDGSDDDRANDPFSFAPSGLPLEGGERHA